MRYIPGYHQSKNGCARCDHIDGPFLAAAPAAAAAMAAAGKDMSENITFMDFMLTVGMGVFEKICT